MSKKLSSAILNLRASVLVHRIKRQGYELPVQDAHELVIIHDDRNAYHQALQQVQRPVSFWSRFKWMR